MPSTKSNNETQRSPGRVQGALLLIGSCMPVLGAVLIAPVLPRIRDEFLDTPGVDALVPLALVIPSLFIALLSPVAGVLADRVGRTRLLTGGLVLFSLAGTAPLWLASLPAIVASRAVLGVAEAVIITCCTTLIGDYFPGARRDRYLGLQVAVTSLAATVFFVVGGGLGETGWRTPFWLYAVGFLLAPLVALLLPPVRPGTAGAVTASAGRPSVPWGRLALPLALTLIGAVLFYVVPTQMSFVLDELGVRSTQTIGLVTGAAALATAIGGFLAGRFAASRMRVLLPVEFGIAGAGLLLLGAAGGSVALATTGAIVTSIGVGLLLPTLLIWTMGLLEISFRGAGTGAWNTTFFLGQFLSPLLLLAIAGGGSLLPAVSVFGWVGIVMVGVAVLVGRRRGASVAADAAAAGVDSGGRAEAVASAVPAAGERSAGGPATAGGAAAAGAPEPVERAEPVEPVASAAPVASAEPAGAAGGAEPVEPVGTAGSGERAESVEPTESVEPVESAGRAEPIESVERGKAAGDVEPVESVEPVEPSESGERTEAGERPEAVEPVEPGERAPSVGSTAPVEPAAGPVTDGESEPAGSSGSAESAGSAEPAGSADRAGSAEPAVPAEPVVPAQRAGSADSAEPAGSAGGAESAGSDRPAGSSTRTSS